MSNKKDTARGGNTITDKVWKKGKIINGENPNVWRKDCEGKKIRRASHGTKGEYAWERDHIKPKSKGGKDGLDNLQPLNTKANREKSDTYPHKK